MYTAGSCNTVCTSLEASVNAGKQVFCAPSFKCQSYSVVIRKSFKSYNNVEPDRALIFNCICTSLCLCSCRTKVTSLTNNNSNHMKSTLSHLKEDPLKKLNYYLNEYLICFIRLGAGSKTSFSKHFLQDDGFHWKFNFQPIGIENGQRIWKWTCHQWILNIDALDTRK